MRLVFGAATDIGQVRSINEDSVLVAESLGAVADGMGGHSGGEVASQLALEAFREIAGGGDKIDTLVEAARAANHSVLTMSRAQNELQGMGTTLCAIAVLDDEGATIGIINVGDSRVYAKAAGEFIQISEDHSFVESLVREGRISAEQAAVHPQRNVLTRALGIDDQMEVDHWEFTARNGDRLLLCSDGLFNEVANEQIADCLDQYVDPSDAATALVELANRNGGHDNISVVIADVADVDDQRVNASPLLADRIKRLTPVSTVARTGPAALEPKPDVPIEGSSPQALVERAGRQRRKKGWRTPIFVLAVLMVLAAAVGAVWWTARYTYFVGADESGEIFIYRGQPDGVLWIDPTVESKTNLTVSQISDEAQRREIEKGREFGDITAAQTFVTNLDKDLDAEPTQELGDDESDTTTTTKPVATTTSAAASSTSAR